MTGKLSIVVPVSRADYEIIKVLQANCFMIADIKAVAGRNILIEIEAFTVLGNEDTN